MLAELGVDIIVGQGSEAGGHRGTFIGKEQDAMIGTFALIPQLVAAAYPDCCSRWCNERARACCCIYTGSKLFKWDQPFNE